MIQNSTCATRFEKGTMKHWVKSHMGREISTESHFINFLWDHKWPQLLIIKFITRSCRSHVYSVDSITIHDCWCEINVLICRTTNLFDIPNKIPKKILSKKYEEFADVLGKVKASTLLEHQLYNCPINLQPRKEPPWRPIYNLSPEELEVLQSYFHFFKLLNFVSIF